MIKLSIIIKPHMNVYRICFILAFGIFSSKREPGHLWLQRSECGNYVAGVFTVNSGCVYPGDAANDPNAGMHL